MVHSVLWMTKHSGASFSRRCSSAAAERHNALNIYRLTGGGGGNVGRQD